jgi:L-ribulose-5-phosphate 4-epimerase
MLCESLRREVLECAQTLPDYALVWMAGGTVCARDPDSGYVVVTPSGLPYSNLTPADMVVTDLETKVIEGDFRPSVAHNLWTAILRARPEIHAIVHTHSTHATAFSVVGKPLPVVTETMANWFGKPIPVSPYTSVEDPSFVTATVKTLGEGYAVLLGRHGPITVGENVSEALERAVTLEESAKIYYVATVLGEPQTFSDAEARSSFDYYTERYGQPDSVTNIGE